jgi:hypothetical protein
MRSLETGYWALQNFSRITRHDSLLSNFYVLTIHGRPLSTQHPVTPAIDIVQ